MHRFNLHLSSLPATSILQILCTHFPEFLKPSFRRGSAAPDLTSGVILWASEPGGMLLMCVRIVYVAQERVGNGKVVSARVGVVEKWNPVLTSNFHPLHSLSPLSLDPGWPFASLAPDVSGEGTYQTDSGHSNTVLYQHEALNALEKKSFFLFTSYLTANCTELMHAQNTSKSTFACMHASFTLLKQCWYL